MGKQHGFTLVELMITLVIAAIILTLAVPSFRDLMQNNRITTQVNEMVSALNMARMEAIRQSTAVSVCASSDQATCSGTNDWAKGWILFTDNNATGNPSVNQIIRVWDALPGKPKVSEAGGASFVRFQSDGMRGSAGALTFNHTIPGCTGLQQRSIDVTGSGRVGGVTKTACP